MDGTHIPNATPFDLISEDAADFLLEAHNWCDGQPVETQEQADEVSRLLDHGRKLTKAAEDARKAEVKPFDDAKAAIQTKYAPLFAAPTNKEPGKVFKALDALKATLAPFLRKQEEAQREAERLAREEAARKAEEAAAAMRAANAADLAAREEAEAKVKEAEQAAREATAASKTKAHATGGERAIGLRTKHVGEITDLHAAVRFYWKQDEKPFRELVQRLVDQDVRAGRRGNAIDGVTITEQRIV
ncbi:hypothetical protein [Brevundimonas sp.]|uniref:hypothetical protein n=1 Tax=Brevundimonas sp. TaxID=1871086 RepID=UPI00289A9123|nr:hypothetical protein [Brevundimonas sp.]